MSTNISLCSFCRHIPLDVDTLEKLLPETRPRSALRRSRHVPLDRGRKTDLTVDLTVGDRAVFALGKAERVLSSDCPFCKITTIALRDIKRVMGWDDLKADTPLSLTWSHRGPGSKGVFRVNDNNNIYICFAEESAAGPLTEDLPSSAACIIRPARAHLDPSSIVRWIANCRRLHGPECNAHDGISGLVKDTYRGLELMRFVDVHKRCIVERRDVVKYVALSYVWGAVSTLRLTTMNQEQMRTPGVFSDLKLPDTIWDAIDVTRMCGQQYLWVDALCIVQNDVEDLQAGTFAMDLIYEMSVFTIVAASGSDAAHGLPGCGFGSRLASPCIEVAPGVRLGILAEVDTLMGASCYNTRGWTLQEEMLSKRILYFVEDRIFFHCPRATLSEDCAMKLRWEPNKLLRMLNPFQDYKELVKEYSIRVLTTQNDALRAMAGIIRRISESQRWEIVEGMPTVDLDRMMLFRGRYHPLSRRPDFPSYSWLGWKGGVKFMEGLLFFERWINWHVQHPATGLILPVQRQPGSVIPGAQMIETRTSDEISTHRRSDSRLSRAGIQMNQPVPSEGLAELHPPPTFSLLCFSTTAVFFELSNLDYVKGKADIIHPVKRSNEIFEWVIGAVHLDGFDEYPVVRYAEFILLSRIKLSENDVEEMGRAIGLEGKEVYIIMLIGWFKGVAERRGIGFIDAADIESSMAPGPVWKEIILG